MSLLSTCPPFDVLYVDGSNGVRGTRSDGSAVMAVAIGWSRLLFDWLSGLVTDESAVKSYDLVT